MNTTTASRRPVRPVGVDELKRAWHAVDAGDFRPGATRVVPGARSRAVATEATWSPAPGEHLIAVLGCHGSAGASTLALALGLAATCAVRVVECCSSTASGLAAASTAELGLSSPHWRHGMREHVLLERATGVLGGVGDVPVPTPAVHPQQLTILDVGWEVGQILTTGSWLTETIRTADQIVLVTTASVPGLRRLGVAMNLLSSHGQPEQVAVAVRGPRRTRWPRGLETTGGPALQRALTADRCVTVPEVRDLAVVGLDSRPMPAPLLTAARQLLDPAHRHTGPAKQLSRRAGVNPDRHPEGKPSPWTS